MHDWLITHPITFAVMLFFAAIPFSLYATEIKQFLKIPPQRLSVWVLKARLSSAEDRLRASQRLRKDTRYFVFVAIRVVSLDLALVLCTVLVIGLPLTESLPKRQTPIWLIRIAVDVFVCGSVLCLLKSAAYTNLLRGALFNSAEHKLNALKEKIERLRGRLEKKGIVMPHAPSPAIQCPEADKSDASGI